LKNQATDSLSQFGEWFFSDRLARSISPFAHFSVEEYVHQLINDADVDSLDEAELLRVEMRSFGKLSKGSERNWQRLDRSNEYIREWKRRFQEERLAGLDSRYRGSQRRTRTAETEARILEVTRRGPSDGTTRWSSYRLVVNASQKPSTAEMPKNKVPAFLE